MRSGLSFAGEHDCCLEPVLDLDEVLGSDLVQEREMVVTLDQPGVDAGVRQLGIPVKLDRTPGEHNRLPGPALGEHTEQVLRAAGYSEEQVAELLEQGAVAGPARRPSKTRSWHEGPDGRLLPSSLLKMAELAERSGVSAPTIRHYIREGLLGDGEDIRRTSRNMAYYPPELVERIQLIKRLQEERFMPLRVIKEVLEENPERVSALLELEDSILERALAGAEHGRVSAKEIRERYEIPANVLQRLKEIGVLTPGRGGYDADDVKIIEAISRFRAGGYEEALGFTVYDTLRYREALGPLVEEEVRALLDRLVGEVEVERAVEMIAAGAEPLRELIGAIHSKLLLAELASQRERGRLRLQSVRVRRSVGIGRGSAILRLLTDQSIYPPTGTPVSSGSA